MWLKDIISNPWVQWLSFLPALEWVNTLAANVAWYKAQFWTIAATTKETVDYALNATWTTDLLNANTALSSWLLTAWAWLLSNKVLKDLWLYEDWKTVWSKKNLARYVLNAWSMLATYSAWTAAAPYLAAWAWAYFVWKYGWKFSKEIWKRWLWTAWWLTGWLVKWAAKWLWNSTKSWIKWEQKLNPVI